MMLVSGCPLKEAPRRSAPVIRFFYSHRTKYFSKILFGQKFIQYHGFIMRNRLVGFTRSFTERSEVHTGYLLYRLTMLVRTWNRLVGFTRPFTECNEVMISLTIPVSLLSHTVEEYQHAKFECPPDRSIHHTSPKISIDFPIFQKIKKFIKLKLAFFTFSENIFRHNRQDSSYMIGFQPNYSFWQYFFL